MEPPVKIGVPWKAGGRKKGGVLFHDPALSKTAAGGRGAAAGYAGQRGDGPARRMCGGGRYAAAAGARGDPHGHCHRAAGARNRRARFRAQRPRREKRAGALKRRGCDRFRLPGRNLGRACESVGRAIHRARRRAHCAACRCARAAAAACRSRRAYPHGARRGRLRLDGEIFRIRRLLLGKNQSEPKCQNRNIVSKKVRFS